MTSLREAADRRVFASVTAPKNLVRLYVPSHELAGLLGKHRPEAKIVASASPGRERARVGARTACSELVQSRHEVES